MAAIFGSRDARAMDVSRRRAGGNQFSLWANTSDLPYTSCGRGCPVDTSSRWEHKRQALHVLWAWVSCGHQFSRRVVRSTPGPEVRVCAERLLQVAGKALKHRLHQNASREDPGVVLAA